MYYLNSRYYDPAVRRFISADEPELILNSMESATYDKNLFAYYDNNPINREDETGYTWSWGNFWTGVFIVAAIVTTAALVVATGGVAATAIATMAGGVTVSSVVTAATGTAYVGGLVMGDALSQKVSDTIGGILSVPRYVEIDFNGTMQSAKGAYDPDPYGRSGQKKQGRENKSQNRQNDNFKPRNNRRDNMPAPPKKHTPSRKGHTKYFSE